MHMRPITRKQREAVHNLWLRSPTTSQAKVNRLTLELQEACEALREEKESLQSYRAGETYRIFRKRWKQCFGDYIGAEWCGMFIGIEEDGYTHS